jgi:putative transposase
VWWPAPDERSVGNTPVWQVLVSHHDRWEYTSISFTDHLAATGVDASISPVGDAYDNALAESTIGFHKTD